MNGEPVYTVGKSFMRDVPLSFEHQMENLYVHCIIYVCRHC